MADNGGAFPVDDGQLRWYEQFGPKDQALDAFEQYAAEILDYAQLTAPWADRTGDARAGLGVEVYVEGDEVVLDLFHTVDYGVWLETIQDGEFAVIMPTLEEYAPRVFAEAGARESAIEGEDFDL